MTSGGSSETELNEFAVKPTKLPRGPTAVTIVTPVANLASASRKSRSEAAGRKGWASEVGILRRQPRQDWARPDFLARLRRWQTATESGRHSGAPKRELRLGLLE